MNLYIVRISDINQIYSNVDDIFKILCEVNKYLSSGEIFTKCESDINEYDLEILKMQNILSIKSAAWLAAVANDINRRSAGIENIYLRYTNFESIKNHGFFEFLGPDIDTGFRISKETRDRRLVLSFELAYILKMQTNYLSKLNLITFKRLKGIWHNKLYPIIWFHDREYYNNISFEDSFRFDELEDDELSREYFNNRSENSNSYIKDSIYEDINSALDKVLIDRNLINKIERIKTAISLVSDDQRDYTNITLLEMHCVAVCFKKDEDRKEKILVAKRNNRNQNSFKWEFGCAKANYKDKITETIKKEYKDDFNIDIEPLCYSNRLDVQPIPLVVYEIEKGVELHKGVIFLAECLDDSNLSFNSDKHEQVKWIGREDIDSFKDEECVSDFKETLKISFDRIEKR